MTIVEIGVFLVALSPHLDWLSTLQNTEHTFRYIINHSYPHVTQVGTLGTQVRPAIPGEY